VFLGLLMVAVFSFFVWLVFFQLKLLRFTIPWAVVSAFFGLHLLLIFLIGLRFVAPFTTEAKVVQHTIQLVPRLTEPTLVTAVLVEQNTPVKKGQPLFQFDRRPYEYKVAQLEAEIAQARQNVLVLKAEWDLAAQNLAKAKSEQQYALYQQQLADRLAKTGAGPVEDAQKWSAQAKTAEASVRAAQADVERARLRYESQVGGVHTTVAKVAAELDEARYYLDNTLLVAPEDGTIINLQVRPGMVSGDYRIGAIASFICDADRYVLATYNQESLKYVRAGQKVEIAFDLYPGQIFKGRVDSIWLGSGQGQYLPSGTLPTYGPPPPDVPQGRFAVKIIVDDETQSKFPIGAQGSAAIYTGGGGFAVLRRIGIRAHSWANWLYPLPF
jgi:multidrug resistance efflux pump